MVQACDSVEQFTWKWICLSVCVHVNGSMLIEYSCVNMDLYMYMCIDSPYAYDIIYNIYIYICMILHVYLHRHKYRIIYACQKKLQEPHCEVTGMMLFFNGNPSFSLQASGGWKFKFIQNWLKQHVCTALTSIYCKQDGRVSIRWFMMVHGHDTLSQSQSRRHRRQWWGQCSPKQNNT